MYAEEAFNAREWNGMIEEYAYSFCDLASVCHSLYQKLHAHTYLESRRHGCPRGPPKERREDLLRDRTLHLDQSEATHLKEENATK